MAYPNMALINGLRAAAANLKHGAYYAWGHHGACNCGQLLQVVAHLSKEQILSYAHTSTGEWTEIVEGACPVTAVPLNALMTQLEAIGLTPTDIHNIEYLEDKKVLQQLPGGFRWLKRNVREDVIVYFETFADQLEEQLLKHISIPYPAAVVQEMSTL